MGLRAVGQEPAIGLPLMPRREATYWTGRKSRVGGEKTPDDSEPNTLSLSLREGQRDQRKAGGVRPEVTAAVTKGRALRRAAGLAGSRQPWRLNAGTGRGKTRGH